MPPKTIRVLGLTIPEESIDISAPRASRHRRVTGEGSNSEESHTVQPSPHPSKARKGSSGTTADPRMRTSPTDQPESMAAKEVAPKKQSQGKRKKPIDAPAIEPEPVLDAPIKKRKTKKGAPLGSELETVSAAPVQTVVSDVGSISIGDSIVPPEPLKKSRKKKDTNKGKQTEGGPLAANPSMHQETNKSQPAVLPEDIQHDGQGTGRIKTLSLVAQQALKQANEKQLEKELKAQRKKDKAKCAVIDESPAQTAAFIAAARESETAGTTKNNIEIRPVNAPKKNAGLQRVQQAETNRFLAQRVVLKLTSAALASPPSSVTGSESATIHSGTSSMPPSHLSSGAPSANVASSRAMSVSASVHSASHSIAYSNTSALVLSQPPTCPASPGMEVPFDPTPTNSQSLTLAQYYQGIAEEFAPRLPDFKPLPPPLREPERTHPVPYQDITKLRGQARKNYKNACKLGVRDLTPHDQIIVSSVLSRLEALINTIDIFPNEETAWHLMLVANAWGCRKHNLGNLRLVKGSDYEELLSARVSQTKSTIQEVATAAVSDAYDLKKFQADSPEMVDYRRATTEYWIHEANFTCPPNDFGAMYERSTIEDVLRNAYFQKSNSLGVVHRDLYSTITVQTLAGAATALEKGLLEFDTGVHIKHLFNRPVYGPKWASHVGALCGILKSPQGGRLANHLRDLSARLLAPFPDATDNSVVTVAPRVTTIANRYGQAIPAPPPPSLLIAPAQRSSQTLPSTPIPPMDNISSSNVKRKAKAKALAQVAASNPPQHLVPVAAPKTFQAPINAAAGAIYKPVPDSSSSSESDSADENTPADAGDPAAWTQSLQTPSGSAAQFDALHALVIGESSPDGTPAKKENGDDEGSSGDEGSEGSDGEGNCGSIHPRAMELPQQDTTMRGPEDESSGSEDESSGSEDEE